MNAHAVTVAASLAPGIDELERRAVVALRHPVSTEERPALGRVAANFGLPAAPAIGQVAGDAEVSLFATGPDDFWIVAPLDREIALVDLADRAIGDGPGAALVLSDALASFRVSGPGARDVLAQGTELDLHPRVFGPARATRTLLGVVPAVLHQTTGEPDPAFEIFVEASYAEWLREWLVEAGKARP